MIDGKKIQELCREKGIKQKGLAAKIGISQSYLSEVEANKKMPSFRTAMAIAAALGVEIGDIVSTNPTPPPPAPTAATASVAGAVGIG